MVNRWPWRIDCIVGARPNFVKIAPILRALCAAGFAARLIHTGQHYDVEMNAVFFRELEIPEPDVNLEVGSGSGTEQTAQIMLKLEPILREKRADLLLVVGDVNSTLAARWSPQNCRSLLLTSRPVCAAMTARCRKKSTGW